MGQSSRYIDRVSGSVYTRIQSTPHLLSSFLSLSLEPLILVIFLFHALSKA